MADDVRVIDIKLEGLDDNIRNMLELQKAIKQTGAEIKAFEKAKDDIEKLQKSLGLLEKAGKGNSEEYKKLLTQLEANRKAVKENEKAHIENIKIQTETKQILKDVKYEVQETIRVQNQQKGSIVELRAQEKLLQQDYINLSRAERESAKGRELQDKLRGMREELNKAGMAAGDFRLNVGRYSESITDAVGKMGGFGQVAAQMKGGMDTIKLATSGALGPFSLIIMALTTLFNIFGQTKAMETFKAVVEGIKNSFFDLVNAVTSTAKAVGNLLTFNFAGFKDNIKQAGDSVSSMAQSFKDAYNVQKQMDDLAVERARASIEQTKREKEISKLMKETSKLSRLSEEEKIKKLKEAGELQKKTTEENVKFAQRELELFDKTNAAQIKNAANRVELEQQRAEILNKLTKAEQQESDLKADIFVRESKYIEDIKKEQEDANKKRLEAQYKRIDTALEIQKIELQFEKDLLKQGTGLLKLELNARLNEIKRNEALTKAEKLRLSELAESEIQQKITELQTKFQEENIKKELERQQRIIELQLATMQKGSKEALNLQLAQLDLQKQAELNNKEVTEQQKQLIEAKYRKLSSDLILQDTKENAKKVADVKLEALQAEFLALDLTEQERFEKQKEIERERFFAQMEQKKLDNESTVLLEAEFKAKMAEMDNAELQRIQQQQQTRYDLTKSLMQGFSDLITAFDNQSEASASFAKALALFQIGLDTASALSGVVANSARTKNPISLPFAIASGTAIVLTNLAKAIKVAQGSKEPKKKKYQRGGFVVEGASHANGGVTFTGDNGQEFEAEGNEALFIVNKKSTKAFGLLDKINSYNGWGDSISGKNYFENGGVLTVAKSEGQEQNQLDLIERAMRNMPSPKVSVEEIIIKANQLNNVVKTAEI